MRLNRNRNTSGFIAKWRFLPALAMTIGRRNSDLGRGLEQFRRRGL
jgi:hypothetical protein